MANVSFYSLILIVVMALCWPTNAQSSNLLAVDKKSKEFAHSPYYLYHPLPEAAVIPVVVGRLNPSYSRQRRPVFLNFLANLFSPFCPTKQCPECATCPATPPCSDKVCPTSSTTSNQVITVCPNDIGLDTYLTAATSGTIRITSSMGTASCVYGIVTPLPADKVTVVCTDKNASSNFMISSTVTPAVSSLPTLGTVYTSTNNFLHLNLMGVVSVPGESIRFTCYWDTKKA